MYTINLARFIRDDGKPVLPPRLSNIGNTCFFNALMILIYRIPEFYQDLLYKPYFNQKSDFYIRLRGLLKEMHQQSVSINSPINEIKLIKPSDIEQTYNIPVLVRKGKEQFDASQCFDGILENIINVKVSPKQCTNSNIHFYSQRHYYTHDTADVYNDTMSDDRYKNDLLKKIQNGKIKYRQLRTDISKYCEINYRMEIDASDPKSYIIKDRISKTIMTTTPNDIAISRQVKSNKIAYSILEHVFIPTQLYLIVTVGLFRYGDEGRKLNINIIRFKDKINNVEFKIGNRTFSLIAMVIHHGPTIRNGHYTSLIRYSDVWFLYNDADPVKKFNMNSESDIEALHNFIGGSSNSAKSTPYMLLYQISINR